MRFLNAKWSLATLAAVAMIGSAAVAQDVAPSRTAQHWIGAACAELGGALKAHLQIEGGLVVNSVVPDAPAAKAGLKVHDVIYAVNGKGISGLARLNQAVAKSKGKAMELAVIRGGKKTTVRVTPASRPAVVDRPLVPIQPGQPIPVPGLPANIDGWLKNPGRFQFLRPGIILNGTKHKFPGDLSVSISKSGDGPAKVTVKRGDEKWEVTEKELDKLPKDIRGHVQAMLGRQPFPGHFRLMPSRPGGQPRVLIAPRSDTPRVPQFRGFPIDIQTQLQQMEEQMKQMRKMIEQLRGGDRPKAIKPKADKSKADKSKEEKKDLF